MLREHLRLVLRLAALRERVARRQRRPSPAPSAMSASTSDSERPCTFACTLTTCSRSRWLICAGPHASRGSSATWPSGSARRRARRAPCSTSGSCARSLGPRARLRRQPHRHVARLAGRVDPVARVDARRTPGRSDCATCPTVTPERAGQPAVELHVQLRLLARAWTGPRPPRPAPARTSRCICSASALSTARVRPAQLELDLLARRRRSRW